MSYEYDAFGNSIPQMHVYREPAYNNPFRYRGYYYDQDLELYYLNSRYYDCFIGRFINADNFDTVCATPNALTDKNLFAYCDNNPVMRRDDGGEFWNVIIGFAVGAVAGAAGQVISDLVTSTLKTDWTFSNWQTYAGAAIGGAVGGAILGGTGNVGLANFASGFITTGAGMVLEKVTNASDKSWAEVAVNAVIDGAIAYGLGKLPGVKSFTKGRNSRWAVYRSGLTKLRNKTAQHMSAKVVEKGITSSFVGGLAMDFYYGIKQYAYDPIRNHILQYGGTTR